LNSAAILYYLCVGLIIFMALRGVAVAGQNTIMMQGPADPSQMQAYQMMQQAMGKLQSKDARGAKPLLEQAASMWPNMPHVHYYLGFCLNDLGDYKQAIPEFEQAIQADPQRVDCMINIATCYQLTGQPGEAATWFERYLKQKPNSPRAGQIKSMIPALRGQAAKQGPAARGTGTAGGGTDYFGAIQVGGKPRRWSRQRMPLRIYIANGTNEQQGPVNGFKQDFNHILADSIGAWVTASANRLAVTYVPDASQADITYFWTDNPNFHAAGGQVEQGIAQRQEQQLPNGAVEISRATVTILVNARDGSGPLNNDQMARTCLHETGHALGLAGHSMNAEDIMFYSELPNGRPELSQRDQNTVLRLYGD
jgi:predicted Zn-dependent protease